jgi:TolA-binding protein
MGKNSEAKKSYERVVKTYPKSAEAVRALKRLQQI